MDQRLTIVEEKIAYLERYMGELDGVVREMHDTLGVLRRELGRVRDQIEQQGEGESDDPAAHKPPHY